LLAGDGERLSEALGRLVGFVSQRVQSTMQARKFGGVEAAPGRLDVRVRLG
jgi:hypothetical protein